MLGQRPRLGTRQKEQPDQHQHPQAEKARTLRGVHATAMWHHRRRRPRPDPPQNRQQAEAPTRRSSWTGCRTWRPYAQSLGDWLRNVKRLQPRLLKKWKPRSPVFAALRSLLKLARARALSAAHWGTLFQVKSAKEKESELEQQMAAATARCQELEAENGRLRYLLTWVDLAFAAVMSMCRLVLICV